MKPNLMSCFLANRSLYFSRASITALMSTSLNVVSSAALSCALFRRLAMVWRIRVILTRSTWRPPVLAAGAAGAGAVAAGAGAASLALAAASTSSLVRRPSLPLPLMVVGSTPCSSTARRTAGLRVCASVAGAGSTGVAAGAASSRAAGGVMPAGATPSSITAMTAPTATVSPTAARCSVRTPATGEGTSTATLSVSRLAIGSSSATASPGCLSHSPMVPSVTDSPMVGTLTSVLMFLFPQAFFLRRISVRTEVPSACAISAACSLAWRLARPVAGEALALRPA